MTDRRHTTLIMTTDNTTRDLAVQTYDNLRALAQKLDIEEKLHDDVGKVDWGETLGMGENSEDHAARLTRQNAKNLLVLADSVGVKQHRLETSKTDGEDEWRSILGFPKSAAAKVRSRDVRDIHDQNAKNLRRIAEEIGAAEKLATVDKSDVINSQEESGTGADDDYPPWLVKVGRESDIFDEEAVRKAEQNLERRKARAGGDGSLVQQAENADNLARLAGEVGVFSSQIDTSASSTLLGASLPAKR